MTVTPKLLLIDEDPADRALAAVVLSSAFPGSFVCEVGDAANLIAALKQGSYDAVVTELDIEAAHWLFQLETIRAIEEKAALVVFTRTDDLERESRALEAGAASYVVKSTQGFLDLAEAVKDALREGPRDVEARAVEAPAVEAPAVRRLAPRVVTIEPPSEEEGDQLEDVIRSGSPQTLPDWLEAQPEIREVFESLSTSHARSRIATLRGWVARLMPKRTGVRTPLNSGVAYALAAVLGVVAISALLLALFATFVDNGEAEPDSQAIGIDTSATAEAGEDLAEPQTHDTELSPSAPGDSTAQMKPEPESEPRQAPPDEPVALELLANDDVWVLVSVDGATVLDTVLESGQSRAFGGQQNIEMTVGNAAGLTVTWNGTDLGSLGRKGQVRRLHFLPTKFGVGPPPATG